ncbi:MAG: hypothetical protein ACYDB7_03420 [Mycobacteriales bacterium]
MTRFARVLLALATAVALTGTAALATQGEARPSNRTTAALPSIQIDCVYIENSNGSVSYYCLSV